MGRSPAGSGSFRFARAGTLLVLAAAAGSACGFHPHPRTTPMPSGGADIVITREQIAKLDVHTAWDVVKRRAPQLAYTEDAVGQPRRVWRHGQASIYLNENPMVYVDGARVPEIQALDEIPATNVEQIRILTGLAAITQYGTNAEGGAILVETKHGQRSGS